MPLLVQILPPGSLLKEIWALLNRVPPFMEILPFTFRFALFTKVASTKFNWGVSNVLQLKKVTLLRAI